MADVWQALENTGQQGCYSVTLASKTSNIAKIIIYIKKKKNVCFDDERANGSNLILQDI